MRKPVVAAVLVLGCSLSLVLPSLAAEVPKDTIVVADGGCASNITLIDGGAFLLPGKQKISVQCISSSRVCVDDTTCNALGPHAGVRISTDQLLATSTGETRWYTVNLVDGGVGSTGIVTVCPQSGATASCNVFTRRGDEL